MEKTEAVVRLRKESARLFHKEGVWKMTTAESITLGYPIGIPLCEFSHWVKR